MKFSMKAIPAACLLALAPAVALANVTPVYQSNIANGSNFTWTYDAVLASDQDIKTGTAPVVNPVSPSNVGTAGFFTIYDFFGYVDGTCTGPANWVCTAQNIGFTPSDVLPFDNPNIVNLTWAHTTGPDIVGNPVGNVGIDLGLFKADTLYSLTDTVSYTSRGWKNSGLQTGTTADNVGFTTGPRDLSNEVPEPGSLALMALGLGFVGLTRRKGNKTA